ncbi:MAG: CoA transferase, partial [Sporomusaceae bacterium]|nr:CoA transferase [Sporomusaceae bacterium]
FCELIGKTELIEDPRFVSNSQRTQNQKELKAILDTVFPDKTVDEWLAVIDAAGIPCGPINTVDRVLKDPQVAARDMIVEVEHPIAGKLKMPGLPIKLSETPGSVEIPAPLLGQHTKEILAAMLGISSDEVDELKANNVL